MQDWIWLDKAAVIQDQGIRIWICSLGLRRDQIGFWLTPAANPWFLGSINQGGWNQLVTNSTKIVDVLYLVWKIEVTRLKLLTGAVLPRCNHLPVNYSFILALQNRHPPPNWGPCFRADRNCLSTLVLKSNWDVRFLRLELLTSSVPVYASVLIPVFYHKPSNYFSKEIVVAG